jgi:hypothetical protein
MTLAKTAMTTRTSSLTYSALLACLVSALFFFPLSSSRAESNQGKQALRDFERIVKKVAPALINKKVLIKNDEGTYYVAWIDAVKEVSYDVIETRSLVSPYIATLNVFLHVKTNENSPKSGESGFTKPSDAFAAKDISDWDSGLDEGYEVRYVYQNSKWVLKNTQPARGNLIPDLINNPEILTAIVP